MRARGVEVAHVLGDHAVQVPVVKERDPARRADLLSSAVTDDVRMVMGAGKRAIRGRAAFEAEIVGLQSSACPTCGCA